MARYAIVDGLPGRYLLRQGEDVISRAIFTRGAFDSVTPALAVASGRAAGVPTIVDVGANLGTFAIPVGIELDRRCRLIAFEAQRAVYYQLCANLFLNDLAQGIANHCAVGNPSSPAASIDVPVLDLDREVNAGGLSLDPAYLVAFPKQVLGREKVPLVALDEALAAEIRLDVLKIDVEGMELDVLEGARGVIARHRPLILCEALSDAFYEKAGLPPRRGRVIELLLALGYELTDLGDDLVAQHRQSSQWLEIAQLGSEVRIGVRSPRA